MKKPIKGLYHEDAKYMQQAHLDQPYICFTARVAMC